MNLHWVIDGGFGFIGSYLVNLLLTKNEKVTICDERNLPSNLIGNDRYDQIKCTDAMKTVPNELVILVLSRSTVKNRSAALLSKDILYEEARISVAIKGLPQGSRVIFISSGGAIYGCGESGTKFSETNRTEPVTPYGKSKVLLENYISDLCKKYSHKLIILRPGNPIGTSHIQGKTLNVVDTFLQNIMSDQVLNIWGNLAIEKDFFDVRDLAEALYKVGLSHRSNVIYNVGSGVSTSLAQLIDLMSSITKTKCKFQLYDPILTDTAKYSLSIQKISNDLNWSPSYTLSDSLTQMYHDYLNHNEN